VMRQELRDDSIRGENPLEPGSSRFAWLQLGYTRGPLVAKALCESAGFRCVAPCPMAARCQSATYDSPPRKTEAPCSLILNRAHDRETAIPQKRDWEVFACRASELGILVARAETPRVWNDRDLLERLRSVGAGVDPCDVRPPSIARSR